MLKRCPDLSFWDPPWFVGVQCTRFADLTIVFQISPTWYATSSSSPIFAALIYLVQYNSDGIVKKFKHPFKSEVVRMKSSYADIVSAFF